MATNRIVKKSFQIVGEARPWMALIKEERLSACAVLRRDSEIKAGQSTESPDCFWLSGPEINAAVQAMPFIEFYEIDESGGRLIPFGSMLPVRIAPDIKWKTLADTLLPERPASKLPVPPAQAIAITRIRSEHPVSANLIRLSSEQWSNFAGAAAEIRLRGLSFAASSDGLIFVRGIPLPSVSGDRFFEENGIATAVGYTWSPAIDSTILRQHLNLARNDLAVLLPDDRWEKIEASNFMAATRSAARKTHDLVSALQ